MNEKKKKIAIPLAILCGGLAIATTALIAIKARRHKIANQSQKENLLQNFKKLQKQLNELLGYKIVNEINVFHEQEVLQGSLKINNKSETKAIEEETLRLKDAITLLISKIKNQINQKELEFAKFNEIKDKLQEYIKNELSKQEYEHIKQNIENELNKYTPISLESTLIEIQNATNNLIKLLNESTKEKDNIDNLNAKEQLKASISQANQLLPQLSDNDSEIAKAKKSLDAEIKNANQAVASNNTASMQSAKSSLDAKVAEITKKLETFNKDKEAKFNELKQTRNQIQEFINTNKNNPNYSELISQLTSKRDSKNSVTDSSNKSDIESANTELKQALAKANADKVQADNLAKSIKEQLNNSVSNANTLSAKLTDKDNTIQQAKTELEKEVQKADQAIKSNNTASMQSAKSSLDAKVAEITKKLETFNKDKEAKFNELKQTRNQIQEFINTNKNNPNYSELISQLTSKRDSKNSVTDSSNKSDIESANTELKQALAKANADKVQADNLAKSIKEQLNNSVSNANTLSAKLTDKDNTIQQAKTELEKEVQKADQAIKSNNTASMQSAKSWLDAKVAEITKKLETFNKDKEAKFNELKQTRNQIQEFINTNKNNPNYSELISQLTSKRDSKNSVTDSSNKSDIESANTELKQALAKANADKVQADNLAKSIKEQLNNSVSNANTLSAKLTDKDNTIQQAKTELEKEVQKANQAIKSNNTASMQSAKSSLDAKVAEITKKLETFNKDKEAKFNELKQTRNQIQEFINTNKNNPNYSELISQLTSKRDSKNSVTDSSNKSDIESANTELKQALAKANADKVQADNLAKSIKEQLNNSVSNANTLSAKLTDKDNTIQQAKTELEKEVQKANQAIKSNNTASMQSAKSSLDAKVAEITKKLETFNKDKEAKFNELKQTRNQIQEFINTNKNNPNYSELISQLTSKRDSKNSVTDSSNKSDIESANTELKQALNTAKAKKSSIDNELRPLKNDLQSKIEEFGPIRNTNFSWISSKLETTKNKLAEELTKADAIKNNPSSSKQALKDSSQQVQKLGNELLKTITEEFGKVETKNSNIGYRLFKLAQAEQFNNSDVDKLKNAWEEKQTLLSKKQKLGNQSTKDYLTQLSTEMSTQESTIKKVIVNIQAHIRNNLNSQYRLEADKLIANMKRGYGDKVGIESLQKWQDLMDDSVLSVDDSLKDDFNKALRVLVGDYTKNPPVSSWFINKRNRSIENYQNLRNLILVRENEILLDKAKDLDKRAEKTIKFVDENINSLDQRAKRLKQEILNAKNDLSNFTLNHQKNQFTAKDITPKISLLENKLNEINQYLLPIIKEKAVSKISEIEKNKKELEDIIRSNFYLWEKVEINKYISELTNKQVELRSNINFENKWESIKDTLDNLNIKENVSLLKEVIINNSNAQYSINRILSTVPEFIKVAQTTRSNNLRSLAEIQFKPTLLDIDKNLKEVKKILDENKTLNSDNIAKLNEKIRLLVDRSRELKESLRWFDRQNENISDQRIKNKLDEVRELLKNV
ncbi:Lmp1 protein [Metamycoplasma hominis ATCC 23114]|uniref:Lmp1 protein n=2 Tax=Metamycoplasma hominis TaxID=2098 RepID=D1J7J0_METH1|nr:Lmp1 protein [Metamycoplasma hominis]CAX37187.1 Lmp1 protein [Metamycoplasma hominis ATCC 23114]